MYFMIHEITGSRISLNQSAMVPWLLIPVCKMSAQLISFMSKEKLDDSMFPKDPTPLQRQHVEALCNEYINSTHLAMVQQ